jgi:hypothetical protein
MNITIQLEAVSLANGKFMPKLTILEHAGNQMPITTFDVRAQCNTRREALDIAKKHAIDELKKNYPEDIKVNFEELNDD